MQEKAYGIISADELRKLAAGSWSDVTSFDLEELFTRLAVTLEAVPALDAAVHGLLAISHDGGSEEQWDKVRENVTAALNVFELTQSYIYPGVTPEVPEIPGGPPCKCANAGYLQHGLKCPLRSCRS